MQNYKCEEIVYCFITFANNFFFNFGASSRHDIFVKENITWGVLVGFQLKYEDKKRTKAKREHVEIARRSRITITEVVTIYVNVRVQVICLEHDAHLGFPRAQLVKVTLSYLTKRTIRWTRLRQTRPSCSDREIAINLFLYNGLLI